MKYIHIFTWIMSRKRQYSYAASWKSVTLVTAVITAVLFYVKYIYWDDPMLFVEYARPEDLQDQYVNKHQYTYTINNNSLCDNTVFLLIFVLSDPQNGHLRNLVRQTWGEVKDVAGKRIVTVFGTARRVIHGNETEINAALNAESEEHHDIIQADFIDSYRNLTYKTIMAFHWVSNYCPNAKYFMKTDDDVIQNIFKIVQLLKSSGSNSNLNNVIFCRITHGNPKRSERLHTKYDISRKEYFPSFYPQYCAGGAYMMATAVMSKLYTVTQIVPFLFLEDVYVGICRAYAGIKVTAFAFAHRHQYSDSDNIYTIIMEKTDTLEHWLTMWRTILSNTPVDLR